MAKLPAICRRILAILFDVKKPTGSEDPNPDPVWKMATSGYPAVPAPAPLAPLTASIERLDRAALANTARIQEGARISTELHARVGAMKVFITKLLEVVSRQHTAAGAPSNPHAATPVQTAPSPAVHPTSSVHPQEAHPERESILPGNSASETGGRRNGDCGGQAAAAWEI